jgi:hypothetical protein
MSPVKAKYAVRGRWQAILKMADGWAGGQALLQKCKNLS